MWKPWKSVFKNSSYTFLGGVNDDAHRPAKVWSGVKSQREWERPICTKVVQAMVQMSNEYRSDDQKIRVKLMNSRPAKKATMSTPDLVNKQKTIHWKDRTGANANRLPERKHQIETWPTRQDQSGKCNAYSNHLLFTRSTAQVIWNGTHMLL